LPYFEAFTYGYLPADEKWKLHQHEDIIEICIVIYIDTLSDYIRGKILAAKALDIVVIYVILIIASLSCDLVLSKKLNKLWNQKKNPF